MSRLKLCVEAAHLHRLTVARAQEIIDAQVSTVEAAWSDAADSARLTTVERAQLWRWAVLNPAIRYDL